MAKRLQHRGGTTAQHSTFTGAVREVTVDTDKNTLVVHDGATAGGHPLATATNFTSTGIDDNATSTAITINSSQNVGIGTASPISALHIESNAGAEKRKLRIGYDGTYYYDFSQLGAAGFSFNAVGGIHHIWQNNGSEKMRIDSSGRVGIGTSSPTQNLDVRNQAVIGDGTDGVKFTYSAGNSTGIIDTGFTSTGLEFRVENSPKMRIDTSGNVSIGTTSAQAKLHIVRNDAGALNDANSNMIMIENTTATGISIGSATTGEGHIYFSDSGDADVGAMSYFHIDNSLRFRANASERMRIDSNGNVGINTTSPTDKLHIAGNTSVGVLNASSATLRATRASGTDINGCDLIIYGGTATGSGTGGKIFLSPGLDGVGSGTTARGNSSNGFTIDFNNFNVANNSSLNSINYCFGLGSHANRGGITGGTRSIVTIDGSGNGTGGTTLEIVGASNSTNGNQSNIVFYGSASKNPYARIGCYTQGTSYTSGNLQFFNHQSGTEYLGFYINGAGIPYFPSHVTTASSANAFLDTNGQLQRSTSSIRYKTNVEDLSKEYSDAILNLRPVWYRSSVETDNSNWSWYGLVAEEVAEIDPRLVHWKYPDEAYDIIPAYKDETGTEIAEQRTLKDNAKMIPDGVQYERLSVLLLDLFKRQKSKLESLEARITALETQP